MAIRQGEYLNLIAEAETAPEFKNAPNKAYVAVGEKLAKSIIGKNGTVDMTKLSFKSMLEAHLRHTLQDPSLVLTNDFLSEYDGNKLVSETVTTGSFPTIIGTVMSKTFIESYNYFTADYKALYTEVPWDGNNSTEMYVPGLQALGGAKERPEGTAYQDDSLNEKWAKVVMKDFGRMISITWEALVTDKTGLVLERCQQRGEMLGLHLAKLVVQSIEMVAARSTMNETTTQAAVFNSTAITQANFYANDHSAVTGLDGQTNDNLVTTSCALDFDGLKEAFSLIRKMTDENGDPITVEPKVLLVPTGEEVNAWQLMNTISQPGTAEAGLNFFRGKYSIVATPFLSDTNSWFLGDFKKQIIVVYVAHPVMVTKGSETDDFFTSKIVKKWRASHHVGSAARDYRYVVRSPGES
jgi:hypothetical protein